MKKVIAIVLAIVICVTLTGCGGNKKAFEESKLAYNYIDVAYEITEEFGDMLYEAWRLGIYHQNEIIVNGIEYLAEELSLSKEDVENGLGYAYADMMGDDWFTMTDEEKSRIKYIENSLFSIYKNNLFSFCVMIIRGVYIVNGKTEEAQRALDNAKAQMKRLSENYSDYEHYPNLKGYYTTTSSFFDFCQNPTGSFEQIKTTVNDYKNEARDYMSDLDYIFE